MINAGEVKANTREKYFALVDDSRVLLFNK